VAYAGLGADCGATTDSFSENRCDPAATVCKVLPSQAAVTTGGAGSAACIPASAVALVSSATARAATGYTECLRCVSAGGSHAVGMCQPGCDCSGQAAGNSKEAPLCAVIADAPCTEDVDGCASALGDAIKEAACGAVTAVAATGSGGGGGCVECTGLDSCGWDGADSRCFFVGASFFLDPSSYVTETKSCPPVACTAEYRECPDGSAMPRDAATCEWLESQCPPPDQSGTTDPVIAVLERDACSCNYRGARPLTFPAE